MPPAYSLGTMPGLKAVSELGLRHVGKDDGVEARMEIAGLDPGVVEAFGREAIFLEDPARPAFIDGWLPRTIEPDAGFMDRDGSAECVWLRQRRRRYFWAMESRLARPMPVTTNAPVSRPSAGLNLVARKRHRSAGGENIVDGHEAGVGLVAEDEGWPGAFDADGKRFDL